MTTRHTYLREPGIWKAEGTFQTRSGSQIPLSGHTTIKHDGTSWIHSDALQLLRPVPVSISTTSIMSPFTEGEQNVRWTSINKSLGRLAGQYTFEENAIVSSASSESGYHKSYERLERINDHEYMNSGSLFVGGERISSWEISLTRAQ